MTTLVAPVVGPLLGGWITDNISWPWIFYINMPVGRSRAACTWCIYRERETPTRASCRSTASGLALLVLWVGCAAAHARQGQGARLVPLGRDRRARGRRRASASRCFLVWELTDEHPVVDLRAVRATATSRPARWRSRSPTALFFGNIVLLPLWLQQYMGYTATDAGLVLAPVGLLAIMLSPLVGRIGGQGRPAPARDPSFLVFALVLWMRSHFNTAGRHLDAGRADPPAGRGDVVLLHPAGRRSRSPACARTRSPPPRA